MGKNPKLEICRQCAHFREYPNTQTLRICGAKRDELIAADDNYGLMWRSTFQFIDAAGGLQIGAFTLEQGFAQKVGDFGIPESCPYGLEQAVI